MKGKDTRLAGLRWARKMLRHYFGGRCSDSILPGLALNEMEVEITREVALRKRAAKAARRGK